MEHRSRAGPEQDRSRRPHRGRSRSSRALGAATTSATQASAQTDLMSDMTDTQPRRRRAASRSSAGRAEPTPPRVLAIANQKGGVGKTTTAINLGTALAAIGEHVLIVDLDPQGNASTGLGIDRKRRRISTYDVLTGDAPHARGGGRRPRCRGCPSRPRRWTSPGSSSRSARSATAPSACATRSTALNSRRARRSTSATCWSTVRRRSICSPSTRWRRPNAILVPLQCEFFALEGLSQLLKTVEQVQDHAQSRR